MSDYPGERSLWVFLSMTFSKHAFMHVLVNMSSETQPALLDREPTPLWWYGMHTLKYNLRLFELRLTAFFFFFNLH